MSVRKRTWTTPAGEQRSAWVADYFDARGIRRRKSFDLKKHADAFEKRAGVEVADGVHVPDGETITVALAGKHWIDAGTVAGLERTTIDQRRQHLQLHIVPFIGASRLNKITGPTVRDFQRRLREAGRSAAMVKRVTVSLGSILAVAQLDGAVIRNAVHELSRARAAKSTEKRADGRLQVGVDIPTGEEVRALLTHLAGRYRPLIVTAVFTGLRSSELRGLRWSDVDLQKAVLHVRQRADRYGDIGEPKTHAGHRSVPLPPMVVNTLREWRLACPKSPLDLTFPNGDGKVDFHQNMTKRGLWPAEIAAGLSIKTGKLGDDGRPTLAPKYPGLHALRHWFASWCINRKIDGGLELPAKAVQARLGHSSITVTFDTYGHLFPIADEAEALAAAETALMAVPRT
jgi:integrase